MKERSIKEQSVVQRQTKENKFKPVVLFFLQRPTPEQKDIHDSVLVKQALSYIHGKKEPSEFKATFAPQSHTDSSVSNLCWAD